MKTAMRQYQKLVGTEIELRGGVFSRKKYLQPDKYKVVDIRISMASIMNLKTKKEYSAFELLVKNDGMKRSQWTRPFLIK